MDLVISIYALTSGFPKEELYGLISQMKRSATSIPSNIAEGRKRSTSRDYRQFLLIAFGSAAELETQMEIAKRLGFGKPETYKRPENLLSEILRMLAKMTTTLKPTTYSLQPTTL